jgi:hypothetical protein
MKQQEDQLWLRSLTLIHEFDRYVLEHPRFAEKIPNGAEVVLLPSYDAELRKYNLRNSQINREPGRPLVYIEIDRLRPRRSLIVRPKLKVADDLSSDRSNRRGKRALPAHV